MFHQNRTSRQDAKTPGLFKHGLSAILSIVASAKLEASATAEASERRLVLEMMNRSGTREQRKFIRQLREFSRIDFLWNRSRPLAKLADYQIPRHLQDPR
jgi:hypothetical protein